MPEPEARRYRLNQFVSSMNAWLPVGTWQNLPRSKVVNPKVFAVDRTPGWDYASIVTAEEQADGTICTELVMSFNNTNVDQLLEACMKLSKWGQPFVMDNYVLADLAIALKQRGIKVQTTSNKDLINASNNAYSRIMLKKLSHAYDEIVSVQMQRAVRKNIGESWKITRKDSGTDIDAAIATILAVWYVETKKQPTQMVF